MAAISSVHFEGNHNHLQQYYLYSPLKRLKDEKIHEIDSTKNYLNNIESKYKSQNLNRPSQKQFTSPQSNSQEQQISNNNRQSHKKEAHQNVQTPYRYSSKDRKKPWPKIFDQDAIQELMIQTERIRSLSPSKMEYTKGVITIQNKNQQLEDNYQIMMDLRNQLNPERKVYNSSPQQLNFTRISTQNRMSVQSRPFEPNSEAKFRSTHPGHSYPQSEKFEFANITQTSMARSHNQSNIHTVKNSQVNINNNIQNGQQMFNIHEHNLKSSSDKKPYKRIFNDRMSYHSPINNQISLKQMANTQNTQGVYQSRYQGSPQKAFVNIDQSSNAEELKLSLVEFNKNSLKTKYERYFQVNGQIINHLVQLKDVESQNTLQQFESDELKKAQSLLVKMLKSIDTQSLQLHINEIGDYLENIQKGNIKTSTHPKSQIISQINLIISQSIEHGNSKLILLIEDEDKDLQYFTQTYEQVLYLGLQLLPKEKVYQSIKKYNILKENWYDFISNQTL